MLTLLCAVVSTAWGESGNVFYTLTPITGTNNAYANDCDITIDDIVWNVTGNSTLTPWRIGGKSLDKVDRTVYSKTAMNSEINKVELTVGNASSITVNSLKLVVASDASFSTVLDEVSATFEVNSTITFQPTSGQNWANNSYYKFVFNVTVQGTNNKFVEFSGAKFYTTGNVEPPLTGELYELINGTPSNIVEGDYIITCNSSSAKYAMSNDVENNAFSGKTEGFGMDDNANIVTEDKTIVWHIAPQGDYWTIQSLDNGQYAAFTGSSDGVTMTSTLDDNALWSYNGNNGFKNKANNADLYFNSNKFSFMSMGTSVFTLYRMPDKYYVAGSWTDWATIEMTINTDGTFTLADQEVAAEAEFKIVKMVSAAEGAASVWYRGEGNNKYWVTIDNHSDISLIAADGENFYIPVEGTLTFIVDPTGDTPKLTVEGLPERAYYLIGDFNEWAITDSYKFNKVGGTNEYTLNKQIKKGEKFKIKDNYGAWFGAVSDGDFWVNAEHVGTDLSLTTVNNGENFYMNLSNKNYWSLDLDLDNNKLTLSNYVSDVAELPFEFDGGRTAIERTPGLTQTGLGTDYGSSPKLKFTDTNNAVVLHFDERPGTLSFDIKGNGFSEGEFVVQTSADGETYNDLKSYTTLSQATTGQHETFNNLGENVRYIKWLYKRESNGNVALGNIKLEKYVAPQSYTVTITQPENAEIFVFYNDLVNTPIEDGDEVMANSEVLVSVSVTDEDYEIESVTVTDGNGQSVTMTDVVGEEGTAWTFIMPSSDVTVACTVTKIPEPSNEEWVLTDFADLTEDDIFVIVGDNGDTYAMSNDQGTSKAPTAVSVTISGDKITSAVEDNIKWNISGNATDGYIFYPNGNEDIWLYNTSNKTDVRIGSNNNKVFKLADNGYLQNTATSRYLGIYNSQDWRCYQNTTGQSNITGQTFGFYKLVKPLPEPFTFTIYSSAADDKYYYATISDLGDGYFKVVGDMEVRTATILDGKLSYPTTYYKGDVFPGNGAYLVVADKSVGAGQHTFPAVVRTVPNPVDNMLYSTGSGSLTAAEMEAKPQDGGNYMFYKLSLNKNHEKIGFYWGAEGGIAFDYGKGHQAFLAVPKAGDSGDGAAAYLFDGDKTGIYSIKATESESNNATYTLSGIRVDNKQLPKGIYIKNGKKVVVR